ncbi:TETRASPANIN [Salix purpurea]|uniref:TETRASPANIN n=1 Tax=Salix purpurea TaxID=77065 RepID=A0A9Q0T1Y3_SALPP|nr:TETRASPANIN [Salix purpurea]
MTRCARCCLRNSIRVVNLIMLVLGAGIIVYSLWLEKKWDHGIAKFPHGSSPLTPWFIFVFLGEGIVVCLSTVGGHIIAHCISSSTLFLKISAYTGEENTCFEMVILINVKIIRAITILILVAQSSVVILAAILLAAGGEPRTHFLEVDTSIFIQSFLVPTESPGFAEISGQACRRCGTSLSLGGGTARRSFLSRIKSLLGRRFQRPNTVY